MTGPDTSRHIEIRDGDHTIAAAEVMTCGQAARTARVWLRTAPGHVPPGRRASLVDAVMDLPEVQASARLQATVPLGDTELLQRWPRSPVLITPARPQGRVCPTWRRDSGISRSRTHLRKTRAPTQPARARWPI